MEGEYQNPYIYIQTHYRIPAANEPFSSRYKVNSLPPMPKTKRSKRKRPTVNVPPTRHAAKTGAALRGFGRGRSQVRIESVQLVRRWRRALLAVQTAVRTSIRHHVGLGKVQTVILVVKFGVVKRMRRARTHAAVEGLLDVGRVEDGTVRPLRGPSSLERRRLRAGRVRRWWRWRRHRRTLSAIV